MVIKLCTKISPGRSHFRARTNTMANQEKDLRNSKPLSKLILVKPLLRNPGWKSMFLLMLNRGSIIILFIILLALRARDFPGFCCPGDFVILGILPYWGFSCPENFAVPGISHAISRFPMPHT